MGLRETNGIFGGEEGGAQSGEEAALRKARAEDDLKGFGSPGNSNSNSNSNSNNNNNNKNKI